MIMVMNTIQVKNGCGDKLLEGFQEPKGVQDFPGFVRMEVLATEGTEEFEEYKVCTTWESKEHFQAWVESDSFKQSHAKRAGAGPSDHMLGAKISFHQIVISH
ncbi:antibiotic biosynthesis monooxygenase [Brevibacillus daliensis]|uniref:antibiotic biosynthesis monooxygenase n=1 Tax=Brevibacillus daliensis TaxID=2892995 RepID=UPI001E3249CA|nr:antibiotic biosynthesis monooxygenase [Brevibacillus daliensis]